MKKIIIFCVFLLMSCNKNESIENDIINNSIFYEDEIVMNDLSNEIKYVDSVYNAALKASSVKRKSKKESLPMNKNQLVHFLKCMNVCSNSNGNLLMVFVNKNNNRIISLNEYPQNIDKDIVNKEQLFDLLRNEQIDFKIIKKRRDYSPLLLSTKSDEICTSDEHLVYDRLYSGNDSFMVYGFLYVDIELRYKTYDATTCTSQRHLPEVLSVRERTGTSIGTYESTRWYLGTPLLIVITEGIWNIPIDIIVTDLHFKYKITTTNYLKDEYSTLSTSLKHEWI